MLLRILQALLVKMVGLPQRIFIGYGQFIHFTHEIPPIISIYRNSTYNILFRQNIYACIYEYVNLITDISHMRQHLHTTPSKIYIVQQNAELIRIFANPLDISGKRGII